MKNINFNLTNFEHEFLTRIYNKSEFDSVTDFCHQLVSGYVDFNIDQLADECIDDIESGKFSEKSENNEINGLMLGLLLDSTLIHLIDNLIEDIDEVTHD